MALDGRSVTKGGTSAADDVQVTGTIRCAVNVLAPRVPSRTPVAAVREVLRAYATRSVAVVDDDGRCLGTVTAGQLPERVSDGAPIADHMAPAPIALPLDAPIALAAAIMVHERLEALPIENPAGKLVAVLEESDLLGWIAAEHDSSGSRTEG